MEELLSVTADFTKLDPKRHLDTNGECINQIHRQDIFQMEGKELPTNFIRYSMNSKKKNQIDINKCPEWDSCEP